MKDLTTTIHFWQKLFSRREVSVICFVLAILFKMAMTFYFFQFDTDKIYQAMGAKSLVEGHGITINQVHANNLSKEYYEPMIGWPPGYTILIAPVYSLVNSLPLSCIIADIIAILFFFVAFRLLLTTLQLPVYLINLLVLFNGLTITSSVIVSAPTDLPALAFILFYCYLQLLIFKKKASSFQLALAPWINLAPAWLRYMYIPTTFVIPALLLWNAWVKKDKPAFKYGIYTMMLAVAGVISLLIFQIVYTGNAAYVMQSERGIFWSNLIHLSPVVLNSFINIDFYLVQLSSITGMQYQTWGILLQLCGLLLFIPLLFRFLFFAFNKKLVAGNVWQYFLLAGGCISIVILLLLGYLSLTHSSYYPPPFNTTLWTYISDARYFVFMNVLLTVVFGKWLFMNTFTVFKGKKLLQFVYIALLSIEILHGMYYLERHFTFDRRNNKVIAIQHQIDDHIKYLIRENKKKNIDVVVTNGNNSAPRAILAGAKGLLAVKELNYTTLHAQQPTLLVFVVRKDHLAFYKPFFNKTPLQFDTKIDQFYIYTYYIEPGLQHV